MPRVAKGHVEQLPSGSWRARVYAGVDPITQREIRLKATAKTEQQAYIELGRLLKQASEGRTPESGATMAKLLDEYAAIAPWDVSTRQTKLELQPGQVRPARPQASTEPESPASEPGTPESEVAGPGPADDRRAARFDELQARADEAARRINAQQAELAASSQHIVRIAQEAQAEPEAERQADTSYEMER
jgi:hypothetical protein